MQPNKCLTTQKLTYLLMIPMLMGISATSDAADAPSYAQLLQESFEKAPVFLEQHANVQAAKASLKQAQMWQNPTVGAEFENLFGPLSGGVSQRQDTYRISQPVEWGGKRSARIESQSQLLNLEETKSTQSKVLFAGQLAMSYATAEAMQARLNLANDELNQAKEDLRIAQSLVKAGREAELRRLQASASVATAQAVELEAQANVTEAFAKLSALVGAKEPYSNIAYPLLTQDQKINDTTSWSVSHAPAVKVAIAERDALASQVRNEEKKALPDINLNAGVRKFAWSNQAAFLVGATSQIPVFDRNIQGVVAAQERVASAEARLEATQLDTNAMHRAAVSQLSASEQRLEAAKQGEAVATEAYRLGRIGYDAGKTSLIELMSIRHTLAEARGLVINARLAKIQALVTFSITEGRMVFGE